jgi:glycine/D-amino acid oxidase-like deaminating enzyme
LPSAVVVGAGVFGASLADRLVARGWEVTLVEQFEPGDQRSESGGETRLLRYSHGPDDFYTALAWRARDAWRSLGVLEEVGMVWFARRSDGWEAESERVLRSLSIPVERLSPAAIAELYPSLRVDDLAFGLLEPAAGALRAGDGVRALVARAEAGGLRLERRAAHPGDSFDADHVIWACGAWLAQLFPSLVQLRVTSQEVVLFDAPPDWAGTPGWLDFDASAYGHGLIEPYGMKVASDREGAEAQPGLRPPQAPDAALTAARDYLSHRFPALAGTPIRSSPSCHYSLTADANFVFARHPEHERVWLLGGGSGHGYKHGPALAEHAADVLEGSAAPDPRFALGTRTPSRALRTAGS